MASEIVGHWESVIFQGQISVWIKRNIHHQRALSPAYCNGLQVPHNSIILLGSYSLLVIWSIDNNSVLYLC